MRETTKNVNSSKNIKYNAKKSITFKLMCSAPILLYWLCLCPFLTVASWPAYRYLKRQIRWSGIPISLNFPQFIVIHTVKGFGIVPYIIMNLPRVYTRFQSQSLLPPSSPYHLSGSSLCTGPKILYPASNLDWRFVSYMILYMFQCHSPKSSRPLPLLQSPKDCSILMFIILCW